MECQHCLKTSALDDLSGDLRDTVRALKKDTRVPKWQWLGIVAIACFVSFMVISSALHEDDPRLAYLEHDARTLSSDPATDFPFDTLASKMSLMFQIIANEEVEPASFQYTTRTQEGKTLAIVNVPTLSDIAPDSRDEIVDTVVEILGTQEGIMDNEHYVALYGGSSLSRHHGPTGRNESDMLAFYGTRPPASE